MGKNMEALSTYARRTAMGLLVATIVIAAAGSVCVANPIVIDGGSLSEDVVTIRVANLSAKDIPIQVSAKYLDGKTQISAEKDVTVSAGASIDVELTIRTITDDINPVGITEGPDPIPHVVVVSAIMQ